MNELKNVDYDASGMAGFTDLTSEKLVDNETRPIEYNTVTDYGQCALDTGVPTAAYNPFNYPTGNIDDSQNLQSNVSAPTPPELDGGELKQENDSSPIYRQPVGTNNRPNFRVISGGKQPSSHRRQASGRLKKPKYPTSTVGLGTAKYAAPADRANDNQNMDPFAHWYQMMSQYYNQFCPGYTQSSQTSRPSPSFNANPVNKQSERQMTSSLPRRSNTRTGAVSGAKTNHSMAQRQQEYFPQQQQLPNVSGFSPNFAPALGSENASGFDYAAYYYHYYYGAAAAAAAAQLWSSPYPPYSFPGQTGRQTPRLYHTPHIRVWLTNPSVLLQILPTRPLNGELALVELIDFGAIVDQAITEANIRMVELESSSFNKNLDRHSHGNSQHDVFSSSGAISGLESPEHLSSINPEASGGDLPEDDEHGDQVEMCAAIAAAWGRADHLYYPGPVGLAGTLKADVLAFLRDRVDDMQDKLPIDWESAGLLLAYLELLIKSNGRVQTGDLVHLLLEGMETQSTSRFTSQGPEHSSGANVNVGVSLPYTRMQVNNVPCYLSDSMTSLNLTSSRQSGGFQSPQFGYNVHPVGHQRPASETGGGLEGSRALIRRAGAITAHHVPNIDNQRSIMDNRALDRFRELLLHGMVMKALEHACHTHLWGHAFVLSQRIGPGVFNKVMDRFLNSSVSPFDPLLTLYQITAGEIPQSINSATFRSNMENGEWRPHLAMILSTESTQPDLTHAALERLGDSLLSRRLVYAAHLCYLLMGPQQSDSNLDGTQEAVYQLPPKIWLLGLASGLSDVQNDIQISTNEPFAILDAPSEALQLTEIYEYAMRLAHRDYYLPQLLPFKLVYAMRLIDSGLLSKASRYLNAIGVDLLRELDRFDLANNFRGFVNPLRYSLVTNCLRLAEPLQGRSDGLIDTFDVSGVGDGSDSTFNPYGLSAQQQRMDDSSNTDWLIRLRELYHRMNVQLGRPSFGMIDFRQPAVSASQAPPTTPTGHQSLSVDKPDGPLVDIKPNLPASSAVKPDSQQPPYPLSPTSAHDGYASVPVQRQHSSFSSSQNPYVAAYPASSTSGEMSSSVTTSNRTEAERYSGVGTPAQHQSMHPNATTNFVQHQHQQAQSVAIHQPTHQQESVNPIVQATNSAVPSQTSAQLQPAVTPQFSNTPNQHQSPPPYHFQMSSQSTLEPLRSPSVHQQQMNSSTANNYIFTPLPVSTDLHGGNTPSPTSRSTFDYFAGMQPMLPRSRNVSTSSQNSTTVPSPNSFQGNRSRNNSGLSQRRGSFGVDRQAFGQQPQNVSSKHAPHHSSSVPHQPSIKEEPQSDASSWNTTTKTEQPLKQEELDSAGSQSQDTGKKGGGWFWGMLGLQRKDSSHGICLPDDSKRSIIWDEKSQSWRDTNDPNSSAEATQLPPPPPVMMPTQATGNHPLHPPASGFSPMGNATNPVMGSRGGSRSRYVNVLANQTSGSASSKLDGSFQPPLPPTMFAPQSNRLSSDNR